MTRTCSLPLSLLAVMLLFATAPAGAKDLPTVEIQQLIEQLGSQEYVARQRAERELLRLGSEAFDALTAAEQHPDLEVAARARYLARRITIDWVRENDPAEVKRIMSGYDDSDDDARLGRVEQLLALPEGHGIDALVRIVRFEKSPLLSKQAAVAWLDSDKTDPQYWRRHQERIDRSLGGTRRVAGQWIRAQLKAGQTPEESLAEWNRLIEAEQQELAAAPSDANRELVLALMRRKVALLKQLGKNDDAVATMIEMIDLEDGDSEALVELVDWLVKQQAWTVIDEVAARFDKQFSSDRSLLYLLAEARDAQGAEAKAQELAEQAFQLDPDEPGSHLRAAIYLQKRGRFDWAEREYRHVIALGPATSRSTIFTKVWLSEMLHDQADDRAASEVLKELTDAMDHDATVVQGLQRIGRDPAAVRSRMEFFFAEHARSQGEFVKQKEHLDRAIEHDPADADVLIAMYHLPNTSDEYQAHTRELIERAAGQYEELVEEFPDDSTGYNQYAWLIGNTEGDLDKAIRYSHRSLEIKPNTAGYLDTLAHAYYTKGDYANAVRYQQQAVDLDPHVGLIRRPLEKFKAALASEGGGRKAEGGENAAE